MLHSSNPSVEIAYLILQVLKNPKLSNIDKTCAKEGLDRWLLSVVNHLSHEDFVFLRTLRNTVVC